MGAVKKLGPILATALLFFAAFPPLNLGLLVFVALIPWLVSLRTATPGGAARGGYTLGILLWAGQMWWLIPLTGTWVGNPALGLAPLAVVCLLGATYFAFLGWVLQGVIARGWIWAIPIAWAGLEVLRGVVPHFAFPYFHLATPLWPFPILTQGAHFGTIYLVSAWVAAINALGFAMYVRPEVSDDPNYGFLNLRKLLIPVIVVMIASALRFAQPATGRPVVVTAGQPGVDLAFSTPEQEQAGLAEAVPKLFEEARFAESQLLVLPEGLGLASENQPPTLPFSVGGRPAVLFGARRESGGRTYQSAFAFDQGWKHADKARLVIFGEYVPGRGVLPFLDAFKLPSGDLTPAERTTALDVGGIRVGSLICFEGLFFEVAQAQVENRAQLLAVMSIDDWYMGSGAPDHLRTAAVWRAVETGLPVVRAGGLGYTMIIDDRGRVLREATLGQTQAISTAVYVPNEAVPNRARPWVAYLMGLALPALAVVSRTKTKKTGKDSPGETAHTAKN